MARIICKEGVRKMPVTDYITMNGTIVSEINSVTGRTDYMRDALGSVTGTVNSAGAVVDRYHYKPS